MTDANTVSTSYNYDPLGRLTAVTINGEEIETTPWHLFYISEGWVEAGDLQDGDAVVSLGGVYGTVERVIIENSIQIMYDLTVEEVHTFAVGEGDWVVHNCNNKKSDVPFSGTITVIGTFEDIGNIDTEAFPLYNVETWLTDGPGSLRILLKTP